MKRIKRFVRGAVDEEVDDELAFHVEMTTRELVTSGMSEAQARAEALERFGDAASVGDQCRRYGRERDRLANRAEYLAELRQDIAFAARQLLKTPGFTAVAVVTLALGIGATATMFSALDAVVLRALPFPNASRIVAIHPSYDGRPGAVTAPEFLAFRNVAQLEHVAAAHLDGGVTMQLGELPEMIDASSVSAGYFAVFGVRPELGRTFTAEEDVAGGPGAAILSHRFWVSRFNADPAVLNRVLQIDGTPHTVIGIMPASFDFLKSSANVWIPLALSPAAATQYGAHYLEAFGRLRPGVTLPVANAAIRAAERAVAEHIPNRTRPLSFYSVDLRRFSDDLVRDYRPLLFILLGAVAFVLLIACGNVANLLLARGMSRAREIAIRAALGAGRGRLFRQMLTEALVLAFTGAASGLCVAFALLRLLPYISPEGVPRLEQAHVDWRVLAFTLLLGVLSSVLFGLVPALRAARPQLQQTLRGIGCDHFSLPRRSHSRSRCSLALACSFGARGASSTSIPVSIRGVCWPLASSFPKRTMPRVMSSCGRMQRFATRLRTYPASPPPRLRQWFHSRDRACVRRSLTRDKRASRGSRPTCGSSATAISPR
jgi:putative ABC transport system permease protein